MSKEKRMFGLIRYRETEEGDRLTQKSVKDTVHVGMGIGFIFAIFIASQLFRLLSQLGNTVGMLGVLVFLGSWGITSYFAYDKVHEKVEEAYRKKGEFYEGNDQ